MFPPAEVLPPVSAFVSHRISKLDGEATERGAPGMLHERNR